MPASLFAEMEGSGHVGSSPGVIEDQRALQLALELSMLGLSDANSGSEPDPLAIAYEESRVKKSQNMTECVPVPSSEHVAEIVGRQGCKIKALRAKTNTYIKTPVRGEEPVFVVTGRREDVTMAKREILSAAEHFSQIRASRKNNLNGSLAPGPPAGVPGQVTLQVRVPYRVVGLVVGPKGATIKRIQQQTHTYIVTPSRDKEPVFEVTGLPESVEAAKKEIEAHIALRTGGLPLDSMTDIDALESALALGGGSGEMFLSSLYKQAGICSSPPPSSYSNGSHLGALDLGLSSYLDPPTTSSTSTLLSSLSCNQGPPKLGDLINLSPSLWSSLDSRDEGLGDSPSFDSSTAALSLWGSDIGSGKLSGSSSGSTSSVRRSSSGSSGGLGGIDLHPPARRISSDPNSLCSSLGLAPSMSSSPTDSIGSLNSGSSRSSNKRDCLLCSEQEVTAALVPCGHNHFCMDCAMRLQDSGEAHCPICQQGVTQAIHIRC